EFPLACRNQSFDKLKLVGHPSANAAVYWRECKKGGMLHSTAARYIVNTCLFQSGPHFPTIPSPCSASSMPLQTRTDSHLLWRHNGCSTSIMERSALCQLNR